MNFVVLWLSAKVFSAIVEGSSKNTLDSRRYERAIHKSFLCEKIPFSYKFMIASFLPQKISIIQYF